MKRPYDTRLLFIGIYLILAQIASFTLQKCFILAMRTSLSLQELISRLIFLSPSFLIAQFRKFHQATA